MLRNLGIGVGLNGVSERKGQVGRRENVVSYPGYGLLNLALYYKVREVQLQLNLNNALNKQYYISGYDRLRSFPGAPRNINLTATYRFLIACFNTFLRLKPHHSHKSCRVVGAFRKSKTA